MANKETTSSTNNKKPGRTLKEKRAAKEDKKTAQTSARKAWEK